MNSFYPLVHLPSETIVFDLTSGQDPRNTPGCFGIGRYAEKRGTMYSADLFKEASGEVRNIHLGLDISAPVGTPVHAFTDGKVLMIGYNSAPGDYGYTLITEHLYNQKPLYVLWGHLSQESVKLHQIGQEIRSGQVIGWMGDAHENGGWPPHLHFQLSYERPLVCDMPGVCSEKNLQAFLKIYPDPRLVLSPGLTKLIDAPPPLE